MKLLFCRTSKSKEVTKKVLPTSNSTQTVQVSKPRKFLHFDPSGNDEYIEITVGELVIGVFGFTFIIVMTLMMCLVLVSGDLFEEPTKTIVKRVIEVMLFSFMAILALSGVALVIMGCTELVCTCMDLCEDKKDIEQV